MSHPPIRRRLHEIHVATINAPHPTQPPSSERGGSAGAGLQHPQHWQLLLHPQSLSSVVISNADEALNINSVHSLGLQQPTSLQGPSPSITAGAHLWLLIYHPSAASSSAFLSCLPPQPHHFPCGQQQWSTLWLVSRPTPHTIHHTPLHHNTPHHASCHPPPHTTPLHTTPHIMPYITPHHTKPHALHHTTPHHTTPVAHPLAFPVAVRPMACGLVCHPLKRPSRRSLPLAFPLAFPLALPLALPLAFPLDHPSTRCPSLDRL